MEFPSAAIDVKSSPVSYCFSTFSAMSLVNPKTQGMISKKHLVLHRRNETASLSLTLFDVVDLGVVVYVALCPLFFLTWYTRLDISCGH